MQLWSDRLPQILELRALVCFFNYLVGATCPALLVVRCDYPSLSHPGTDVHGSYCFMEDFLRLASVAQ